MQTVRTALLGAVASIALLAGAGAALAQTRTTQHGQVIEVPPGAVVLVLPGGVLRAVPMAMPMVDPMGDDAFPSPVQMIRQMDAMMANAQRVFAAPAWTDPERTIQAAMRGMPQAGNGVSGVVVTVVLGRSQHLHAPGSRTWAMARCRRSRSAPRAGGCAAAGLPGAAPSVPAAEPEIQAPQPLVPHTLRVENRARSVPMELASAAN